MQNNNIEELDKSAAKKEESYGGFQYKHNYDEYKKELMEKQRRTRGSVIITVLVISGFVVLSLCLTAFIADTVLRTKGSSLSAFLFRGSAVSVVTPPKSELNKKQIDEASSKVTVSVTSDKGECTGIILTADGYIVTTYGIASDGQNLKVVIKGRSYDAETVGLSKEKGIAVIHVNATGLSTAEIGYSRLLESGQEVFCKPSADKEITDLVIYDASDNNIIKTEPKCEYRGAPVINSCGEVVGIVSDENGDVLHMDCLLPDIKKLLKDDSSAISVSKSPVFISSLGIYVENVSEKQSEVFKIPVGCFISSVRSSTQFIKGDIITEVNGKSVSDVNTIADVLTSGSTVKVYRNNAYVEFTLQ